MFSAESSFFKNYFKTYKPLHNKGNAISINKLNDLKKFGASWVRLDITSCNANAIHRYLELNVTEDKYGLTKGSRGGLIINMVDICDDDIALDFIAVVKCPNYAGTNSATELRDKQNIRLRLQAQCGDGRVHTSTKDIRFLQPQVTDQIDIGEIGFPPSPGNWNEANIVITFNQPIAYYLNEIKLYNESEDISPKISEASLFPLRFIEFDLSKFKNSGWTRLELRSYQFQKREYITNISSIKLMYPQLFVQNKLTNEPSISSSKANFNNFNGGSDLNEIRVSCGKTREGIPSVPSSINYEYGPYQKTLGRQENCNSHLLHPGILVRCRYRSEIQKGNHSALTYHIQNLSGFVNSKIVLDLVMWHSDEPHVSMKLYMIKPCRNFEDNEQGIIEGIIDSSMIKTLSLDFLGIEMIKKKATGKDSRNCRLRINIEGVWETSRVIRHLDSTMSGEFNMVSVALSTNPTEQDNKLTCIFSTNIPYYRDEFVLLNGNDEINPLPLKDDGSTLHKISFNLKSTIHLSHDIQLACPIFDRFWLLNRDTILKVFGHLDSDIESRGNEIVMEPETELAYQNCDDTYSENDFFSTEDPNDNIVFSKTYVDEDLGHYNALQPESRVRLVDQTERNDLFDTFHFDSKEGIVNHVYRPIQEDPMIGYCSMEPIENNSLEEIGITFRLEDNKRQYMDRQSPADPFDASCSSQVTAQSAWDEIETAPYSDIDYLGDFNDELLEKYDLKNLKLCDLLKSENTFFEDKETNQDYKNQTTMEFSNSTGVIRSNETKVLPNAMDGDSIKKQIADNIKQRMMLKTRIPEDLFPQNVRKPKRNKSSNKTMVNNFGSFDFGEKLNNGLFQVTNTDHRVEYMEARLISSQIQLPTEDRKYENIPTESFVSLLGR